MKSSLPFFLLGFLMMEGLGCGGDGSGGFGPLKGPSDMALSSTEITFRGKVTRFAYVANQQGGSASVIDTEAERLVDTADGDDFDKSSLVIGGQPIAVAVDDRGSLPRVFVVDVVNRELQAYDLVAPSSDTEILTHEPVALGTTKVARATRALFEDNDRFSAPVLNKITVNDVALAKNEHWEVKAGGDETYRVTGSLSGEQSKRAEENTLFTSDDGAISFTIETGAAPVTKDDRFLFGVAVTQPLDLSASGTPFDLLIDGNYLYIVTTSTGLLLVFNLDTLAIESTVDLDACAGGGSLDPGKGTIGAGHLYIPDQNKKVVLDVTIGDLSCVSLVTGVEARFAGFDESANRLFLLASRERQMVPWDLTSGVAETPVVLSDFGLSYTSFVVGSFTYGLVPNMVGASDLIDLATLERVDTDVTSNTPQSEATDIEFFDTGATSAPQLISVKTTDRVTVTERWQLIYEGVIPETANMSGTVNGDQFTVVGAQFTTNGVEVGDQLMLNPVNVNEAVEINEIISDETLGLREVPTLQGELEAEVRAKQAYLALASISGFQGGRIKPGRPYVSSSGGISLTVRGSALDPVTRGDFFSFLTIDGIDPIRVSNKRLGLSVVAFDRLQDGRPTAFVGQAGTDAVSSLDLLDLRERKSIF